MVEFSDEYFKPTNIAPIAGRGPEQRPMRDLAAVEGHGDRLPEAIPKLGAGPTQVDVGKPRLVPAPGYSNFQMSQNVPVAPVPRDVAGSDAEDLEE
jgi:hypothetical protein